VDFRAVGVTLGMRCSGAVSTPSSILAEPANMAELVAAEAPADSKVGRVRLAVKDLGLPDKATLAQACRCVCTA
jgi:hypothetical protein